MCSVRSSVFLIWQETQTEGKEQVFLEHLPSAMLNAGCSDSSALADLSQACKGQDDIFLLHLKTEAQRG